MNIEYLKALEGALAGTFEKHHETHEHLDTKAQYICTAFSASLAWLVKYTVENYANAETYSQVFTLSLYPSFLLCVWFAYSSLKPRPYDHGMGLKDGESLPDLTEEQHYKFRIENLFEANKVNKKSNIAKSSALHKLILTFIMGFLLSGAMTLLFFLFNYVALVRVSSGYNGFLYSIGACILLFIIARHKKSPIYTGALKTESE